MAQEPFLINPPKHAPKHRRSNIGMRRHRILAFEGKDGNIFTSSAAKLVRKGIKINPFRSLHHNPMGEELMFIGANPRKVGGSMHLFGHHKIRKHRSNPKRHRKHYKHNPAKHHARRRYHHNPMGINMDMLKTIISAGIGAIATRAIPGLVTRFVGLNTSGMVGYLVQAGVLVGGGMAANKFVSKDAGTGFMAGSGAIILTDVASNVLGSSIVSVAASTAAPTAVAAFERPLQVEYVPALGGTEMAPYAGMGAFERGY